MQDSNENQPDAAYLRRLAGRCLRLAEVCNDDEEAARLRLLAKDYSEQAAAMESQPQSHQTKI